MQRSEPDVLVHGVVGGVLAGAVVATWFFAIDLAANQAFLTPSRLASVVLGEEFSGVWPRHVAVYTIMHFGVFVVLGVGMTALMNVLRIPPGLTMGAVFGLAVLNAVHYTGLLVTGTNLLTVVPVGHVVVANLIGGMLMMGYLHRAVGSDHPFGWNVLRRYPMVFEGFVMGLIGAATVAFWFFAVDLVSRTPFYTPAAIASAVLLGARNASAVQFSVGIVVAYTFLHLIAFLGVGLVFAWLVRRVERTRLFLVESAAILLVLEGLFFGSVGISSGWVLETLGWVPVLIANVLAVASMGTWVWQRHPEVRALVGRSYAGGSE